MFNSTRNRCSIFQSKIELSVASFLDPRFRNLNSISVNNRKKSTYSKIISHLMLDIQKIKYIPVIARDEEPAKSKKSKFSLWMNQTS